MSSRARFSPSLAKWSLAALAVGLGLGLLGQATRAPFLWALSGAVAPLGTIWINALQMVVIPLVVTQLLAALVRPEGDSSVGRLGGHTLGLFLAFLLVGGTVTLLVTPSLLGLYTVSPDFMASWRIESIPAAALEAARSKPMDLGRWLIELVPRNPFEAAAQGNILQMLVFTVLLGVAASRLPARQRGLLAGPLQALADAMMVLVSWVLWGTPVGVFSLILGLSLGTGLGVLGLLAVYVVLLSGLLILVTIALYPLTAVLGRVSLRSFARGAAPAQLVAAGTQSSLASLPALIEGAQNRLRLPPQVTSFVLPLSVSSFKLNQVISPTFKFLFLAHVFGIPLGVGEMATFLLVTLLLSFGVAGVPRGGGGFRTLPLYVAAGIPIEGVVLLEAVKTIPDVFMTVLNVTADLSVATILGRRIPQHAPEPAESVREVVLAA